jgi:hypothetical protein
MGRGGRLLASDDRLGLATRDRLDRRSLYRRGAARGNYPIALFTSFSCLPAMSAPFETRRETSLDQTREGTDSPRRTMTAAEFQLAFRSVLEREAPVFQALAEHDASLRQR